VARPNPHAGKTIVEIMWEELDEIMDRLMEGGKPTGAVQLVEDWQAYGEERGQAQGVAYCLAVVTNPYDVNVDEIKKEALARWKERHDED
jgi:hypothetical protein